MKTNLWDITYVLLSIAWLLAFIGISERVLDVMNTTRVNPIMTYGITESCLANEGHMTADENDQTYFYTCSIEKYK